MSKLKLIEPMISKIEERQDFFCDDSFMDQSMLDDFRGVGFCNIS
jgi:hypothetical protein